MRLVNRRVVLDAAARTDVNALADVGAASDVVSSRCARPREPEQDTTPGAGRDNRAGGNVGAGLDPLIFPSPCHCTRVLWIPSTARRAPSMCDIFKCRFDSDTWVVIPAFNRRPSSGRRLYSFVSSSSMTRQVTTPPASPRRGYTATHPLNLGRGAALQAGFDAALARGAHYVVTFDADGQRRRAAAMVEQARREDRDSSSLSFPVRFPVSG